MLTGWIQCCRYIACVEAEKAILSNILLNGGFTRNGQVIEGLDRLSPDDFFLRSHRRIFSHMREMSEQRIPIEFTFLTEVLFYREELEKVGGAGYIASLTEGIVSRRMSSASFIARYTVRGRMCKPWFTAMRLSSFHLASRIFHCVLFTICPPSSTPESRFLKFATSAPPRTKVC